jgi:hypothetical protein
MIGLEVILTLLLARVVAPLCLLLLIGEWVRRRSSIDVLQA